MEQTPIALEELFEELKDRAFTDCAFSREEWDDLIIALVQEKRAHITMTDDAWTALSEALRVRYEEFQGELAQM